MKGYVINKSSIWMHVMKRSVRPGEKIELSELYEQYGTKHDLAEGEEFTQWLRNVKLKDRDKWGVVLEDPSKKTAPPEEPEEAPPVKPKTSDNVVPPVPSEMSVADVVGLSVRKAREALPKVMDIKLLKYSYEEARQLAGKDSLCREIKKRIKALELYR